MLSVLTCIAWTQSDVSSVKYMANVLDIRYQNLGTSDKALQQAWAAIQVDTDLKINKVCSFVVPINSQGCITVEGITEHAELSVCLTIDCF